jgi:pyruvate formate lyase activating enzyme
MLLGGLQKLTLVDYPSKIAATVFTSGCNFRCPFCQNPELVLPERMKKQPQINENDFFDFLKSRQGLLDGICLTGGEPTIQPDLPKFIRQIKNLGFLVKLDTNGYNPSVLDKLVKKKLVDYLAMDIKSSPERYSQATGLKLDLKNIQKSIDLVKNSGLDYEFRITVVPTVVDKKEVKKIGQWIQGVKLVALQQFQNQKTLDKRFKKIKPYLEETLKEFLEILKPYSQKADLRT